MNYKREQIKDILSRIDEQRGKLQVIVGPRQVGKTTLIVLYHAIVIVHMIFARDRDILFC